METLSLIIIIFLMLVIGLMIQGIIAKEFYNAAVEKGYRNKKYFWYCFLFGLVGYLLVIALPTRNNRNQY